MARQYLIKKGYEIIAANVKTGYKEIDIVARDLADLVFVEVRTRTSDKLGRASEALTPAKTANLNRAAELYLARHSSLDWLEPRLDFIAVDVDAGEKTVKIRHYKNLF